MAPASKQVWLGLAGDLVAATLTDSTAAATTTDHYTTRIGGPPVFPGSTAPPWPGNASTNGPPKCRVCGSRLSLVLQAYAPLPDLPDRVLLLLGCTKAGCGKSPGCWQAVRCQLPPVAAAAADPVAATADGAASAPPSSPPQQQPQSSHAEPAPGFGFDSIPGFGSETSTMAAAAGAGASTDWGFGGGGGAGAADWDTPSAQANGGGNSSSTTTTDAFDFSDLTSSLTATVQQHQQHQEREQQRKREERKQQQQAGASSDTAQSESASGNTTGESWASSSCRGSAGPQLPEFYLLAELEPDASASKAIPRKELQHVQQLLAAYESAEASSSSTTAATNTSAANTTGTSSSSSQQRSLQQAAAGGVRGVGGTSGSSSGGGGDGEGGGEEAGASWAGEEYEPDSVQCMQRSYLKFMKRVARQPQQCARYSHHGPLLWPSSQPPQPSPCPHCGGPRVFEVQLMPALSQMVLEAAVMMQEADLGAGVNAAVVNAVANWDWCTVAVFSCQSSCCGGAAVAEGECHVACEEVFVVNEAECEVVSAKQSGGGGGASGASAGGTKEADEQLSDEAD